jgi:hypothetical protein
MKTPLQRYEIDEHGCDIPVSDGDWVKWEDIKKLEKRYNEMLSVLKFIDQQFREEYDVHGELIPDTIYDISYVIGEIRGKLK